LLFFLGVLIFIDVNRVKEHHPHSNLGTSKLLWFRETLDSGHQNDILL